MIWRGRDTGGVLFKEEKKNLRFFSRAFAFAFIIDELYLRHCLTMRTINMPEKVRALARSLARFDNICACPLAFRAIDIAGCTRLIDRARARDTHTESRDRPA